MENTMHNATLEPVPYIAHEAEMARMERVNKRWFIAWLVTFILLVGCVAGFIWYEAQFVEESVWQEVDTGDGNAYVAGIGDITYGESQTKSDAQDAQGRQNDP